MAGAGSSGRGGGEREGAEEGRSWSAKAGGGEMGEESLGGRSCQAGRRKLEEAKEVSECDKLGELNPGSGTGAVRHLGGTMCPILCQLPTLDVFILAAPTGSALSAQ